MVGLADPRAAANLDQAPVQVAITTQAHRGVLAVPISALLQQLNRQGVTLVVVTHDPLVAAAMGRQVQLRDGQIVADSGAGSGAGGGRP